MFRKLTFIFAVILVFMSFNPITALSQNLTLMEKSGYKLISNTESVYNFTATCVGNEEEYYLGFMSVSDEENNVYTFCSIVYNSDLGQYKLTEDDINEVVNLLNGYLPEGLWYTYSPEIKKLALHYMVYDDLFLFINDERAQKTIVNVFDVLLKCACSFDILTPEFMKEYKKEGSFGIAGGGGKEKDEVLKKFKSASEKLKIKLPEINLRK